jgi:hypothetical protein
VDKIGERVRERERSRALRQNRKHIEHEIIENMNCCEAQV